MWFQDEARVGQKNTLTRRWARRGTRPRAAKDQRFKYVYLFGAICPERGVGAGLVLPHCNAAAMTLHLQEISRAVAPDAHAALVLDQAGWHIAHELEVPQNITLVLLPSKSPELNPVENVWQFMRQNWLSNRVFKSYADIVEHCCFAWTRLIDQPLADHVPRPPRLGLCMMISAAWYYYQRYGSFGPLAGDIGASAAD